MKAELFLTLTAAATLLLAGCNKDNNETVDNWNGEIRLSSGVTLQQTRATGSVPDTQIASGQTAQVVVAKQSADQTAYTGYTHALTATGSGGFAGTTMYYPQSGKGVNIYAYHPSTAATSFVTNTDQSTAANYYNSDLLYSAAQDYSRQSGTHSLTFTHQLSKLTYELQSGAGVPTIAGATVEWTNVCNTATFSPTTGAVSSPTNPVAITPHATYGAIIVPQTVNNGTAMMKVTLASGSVLTYKPSADQTFEGGKKYHYKIAVNLSELSVTSTITDWDAVGAVTGTAEMD